MYTLICPYGCKTPKRQQPKSFTTQETYDNHMKEMHNNQHPIRDFSQEIDDLSREIKELKIANEALQSQQMVQSQLPSNIDLRPIKKIVKKKNVKKSIENEINKKMIEDEDDEETKDNNKKLT